MCPLSCANWNNTTISGVSARNWNNWRSNSNNNTSARARIDSASNLTCQQGKTGAKGAIHPGGYAEISGPLCFSSLGATIHMPKRHGHLYAQIATLDALYSAYLTARTGKRARAPIATFERDLGANLAALEQELLLGTYHPQPYRRFMVTEGRKPRVVVAPAFRDVVVQHAIYAVVYPLFDSTFIHDSYGCRKGKGTHKAADQAQRFLRQSRPDSYTLQLDIRRFYYSIDHAVLRRLIGRVIKDKRLIDLMMVLAENDEQATSVGVPIGNLMSQLAGLIMLNPLDHYIKRDLSIRRYVRYVDDMILFDLNRDQAHALRQHIEAWIDQHLALKLSHWTIATTRRGVNFVGYRTWRKTRVVRKRSLFRFRRALKAGRIASLNSLMGHALRTSTHRHYCRRIRAERPDLIDSLPLYEDST